MRTRGVLAVLSVACGCGQGPATPPRNPPPEVVAAPKLSRAEPPPQGAALTQPDADAPDGAAPAARAPAVVGHLRGVERLSHLYEALAALEDGHGHDDVRILQYGDSHTASDLGVGVFRHELQARFGDGGRGFVSVGKPWRTYVQDGVRSGMDGGFEPTKVKYHRGSFTGLDGCYGLLGIGIASSSPNAHAWTELTARASRIELDYGRDPHGGSFDVWIDGARAGRVSARSAEAGSGWTGYDVADAPHRVEVRTVGDGDVRIYGMTLDRAEAGVVVDALGINGAQIFTPLRWSEAHFAEQLRHANPDLVVLAYGTNEALEPGLTDAQYEHSLVQLLGRVARAVPASSCLLLGPPDMARRPKGTHDWRPWPRLADIIAVQKRVAQAAGCAFYDRREAMGGPGSIMQWANEPEPRAAGDRVHLRRSGYAQVATSFATDLMRAYDVWRAEKGLPPTSAPSTWGGRD